MSSPTTASILAQWRAAPPSPLRELTHYVNQGRDLRVAADQQFSGHFQQHDRASMHETQDTYFPEVDVLTVLRRNWRQTHYRRQLQEVIASAPEAQGPLNPERLITRTLDEFRKLSPELLAQYLGYIESMHWINQMVDKQQRAQTGRASKSRPSNKK